MPKGPFDRVVKHNVLCRNAMEYDLLAALRLAPMYRLERLLLLIAASTLVTEAAFAQGTTITSLNTQDTLIRGPI